MNWFLDMCIIIFYAEIQGKNYEMTAKFVKEKKENKFLLCFYISKENMPKWIKREKIILKILGEKVENPSHEVEKSEEFGLLFPRDVIKLKKLVGQCLSSRNKEEYYEKIKENQIIMLKRIDYFLTNLINKEVIPVDKIDQDLKSAIFTFTNNMSDSLTITSGIQHNQEEDLTLITGDKHDWNKDNIQWVYDSRPDLAKKYSKVPEIRYIQDM